MREVLSQVGLVNEEIDIYITLLRKGPLTVSEISKELSLARTTVYRFVTSLHEKGFISETNVNYTKTYSPIPPDRIKTILKNRLEEVEKIIPELNKIFSNPLGKTNVVVFRGKEGIKAVMDEIIKEAQSYTCFGEIQKFFEEINIYTKKWMQKAETKKILGRLLGSKNQNFEIAKGEKIKYVSEDLISTTTTITFGEKTAIFIWTKPLYGILIEDKEVTKNYLKSFNYLWNKVAKK